VAEGDLPVLRLNVILAYCPAHARRKVFELREDYPAECAVVLDGVGKVYGRPETFMLRR